MDSVSSISTRKRTLILINLIVVCIASSFLSTALTTALPPIASEFQVDISTGQWLTSSYSLAMGIMMPLTAFLITRFRTKPLYLSAVALFLLGSFVCILAPNFPVMMAGRVIQAASNGITTSMAQVVLLSIYPKEKQGSIMGWYGLSVSAAPVIAPTLAGLLADTLGWKMIFILPSVIVLAALVAAVFVFNNVLETRIQHFDVVSFVFSAIAFGGLTLGIGNISSHGIMAPIAFVPMAFGIVGAAVFVWRQLNMTSPFLELRLFANHSFAVSVLGSMLLYLSMMGSSLLMALYVQSVLGLSAATSGLVTLPGSLASALISPLAGKMYDKFDMKRVAIAGASGLVISNISMGFISLVTPLYVAVVLNILRNASIACLLMPFVTWGLSKVDSGNTAHGSALLTALRTIAGAIGAAMFVGIMNNVTSSGAGANDANAGINGINMAYRVMACFNLALLVMSVFCIRSTEKKSKAKILN